MKVSVVIPTYNEEKYIQACLQALLAQKEPADEILVIDNNSTDATTDIVRRFPEVTLLKEKKQGIIPARNKGFNSAKYDIIARTDADTRVPKNWIKNIKKTFRDTDAIALSGPAKFYDMPKMRARAYWQSEMLFFKSFQSMFHHEALFGPNMAIRKSAWIRVRKEVCLSDKVVHEDIDLAIHLSHYGNIMFDNRLYVASSSRRWKKLGPYFEYPYRYLRTIQHHRQSLHPLKTGTSFVTKKISLSHTKQFVKHVRSRIQNARSLFY